MALSDSEISGLFNYIRFVSKGVYPASARLAGMLFSVNFKFCSSDRIYTITRRLDDQISNNSLWSMEFMLVAPAQYPSKLVHIIDIFKYWSCGGVIKVLRINGDYDAYMKDATLVRMFSSIFEDIDHNNEY